MADISKITLPSGNTYDIKDAVARQAIAGGISFVVAWNGSGAPVVSGIPYGVVVTYNDTNYTGTLAASATTVGAFYLVKSSATANDIYSEYVTIITGGAGTELSPYTYGWEKLGDTTIDLSGLGALAWKDSATVTFTGGTTDKVLGSDATFTTTVTPTTTNIKATASGTAVAADGTASVVTGYESPSTDKCLGSDATFTTTVTPTTTKLATTSITGTNGTETVSVVSSTSSKKLTTTTVPNVTANSTVTANKSTWTFSMGTGANAETLIIGGGNGSDVNASAVTLGTAITVATGGLSETSATSNVGSTIVAEISTASKTLAKAASSATTVATGSVASNGGGATVATGITSASTSVNSKDEVTVITGLGTAITATALTGVKVTTQPTIALATGATAGAGVISVATGITSASTSTNNKDEVTAVTSIGTGTAS